MHRRVLGVAVAFVLAAGALAIAPSTVAAKGRSAAKPAATKKSAKSSSKAVSKKSAARSNNRASARAGKRGKNASSKKVSRTTGRRSERRPAYTKKDTSRLPVAKSSSLDDDDDGEDDTPTLRAANRYVADISPNRVIEIQNALIKAGAFAGPATGVYDQSTFDAMTSFQSRRGFGATGMPTAEALKALGVRKNSGIGITTPSTVLRSTTPGVTSSVPTMTQSSPNR
jgi:hypothetical protein